MALHFLPKQVRLLLWKSLKTHWETWIGYFIARLMATSYSLRVLMIWGCLGHWGHWGHWGCWGSWWHGNHPVIKAHAAFDFLRPKRLLRSLRPLKFSKALNLIARITVFLCLKKKNISAEWWNYKWNSAIIQVWGCGGQGCYFQPNPNEMSESHKCTNFVFMT